MSAARGLELKHEPKELDAEERTVLA